MILPEISLLAGAMLMTVQASQTSPPMAASAPLHVSNTVAFNVQESQEQVGPLFGAHKERVWAEGWDPKFIFPLPAEDRTGSVFQVPKGQHESTWITTIFDLPAGHIQHVYFIPDVMVVLIDIHLSSAQSPHSGTHVEVRYERTALSSAMNDHIQKLGEQDAQSAEEWRSSIENYFQRAKTQ